MTVTFICYRPTCRYYGQHRTVRLQHVAQGLYIEAKMKCECGSTPQRVYQVEG